MKRRPQHVKDAVMRRDSALLSKFGRKGAKESTLRRAEVAETRAILREKQELEEWKRRVATNEHIAPID